MHETYMNFMFRLESHAQDIPRVYVDIPNLEKKLEALLSQAFQTWMYNLNQASSMVFH